MSSKGLKRLVMLAALLLLVGTPVVVAAYLLDQRVEQGPTLAERRLAEVEAAAREHPDDVGLRLALAATYVANERPQDAVGQYDAVLKAMPENVSALLGKAMILADRGDAAGATPLFERIVSIRKDGEFATADTDLQQAYYGLGSVAVAEKRFDDAVAALESATRIGGTDADTWYLLGVAQLGAGRPLQAVQAEQNAVTFVPTEWAQPYDTMAKAYAALGKRDHTEYALAMVDLVEKRYPEAKQRLLPLAEGEAAAQAAVGLGLVSEKLGDAPGAIEWYRKALDLDPHNVTASGGLSRLGVDLAAPSPAPGVTPTPMPSGGNG